MLVQAPLHDVQEQVSAVERRLVFAQRHSIDSKESAEWFLRSIFADQHHWPPIVIAAFANGLFLAFLCWVADLAIRRFVSDERRSD